MRDPKVISQLARLALPLGIKLGSIQRGLVAAVYESWV
jgi:hypothetical protein